jgi:hypothetical protein
MMPSLGVRAFGLAYPGVQSEKSVARPQRPGGKQEDLRLSERRRRSIQHFGQASLCRIRGAQATVRSTIGMDDILC